MQLAFIIVFMDREHGGPTYLYGGVTETLAKKEAALSIFDRGDAGVDEDRIARAAVKAALDEDDVETAFDVFADWCGDDYSIFTVGISGASAIQLTE